MRNTKPLAILSASAGLATLAAAASADDNMVRLAPNDVPVICATICGPVVELTGICHIGTHDNARRLKRRRVEEREKREVYKRQFVTNAFGRLVPAPIPKAAKTVTQIITQTAVGAAVGVATGLPVAAGAIGGDAVDGDENNFLLNSPGEMSVVTGNAIGGSENLELDDGSSDMLDDMSAQTHKKESDAIEQAEEDCICKNKSFQVPLVSALCASCIQQEQGNTDGPMSIIMSQCNFTKEELYDPSRETAVFNVRVQASRPTVSIVDSSNVLISDSPPSPRLQTSFVGAIVAGVACGIAMML